MPKITDLGSNIYQIDVCDQEPERTACYLILAEKAALIETGPTPGTIHIKNALRKLDIPPEKIDFMILTHVHLDHAGGAGVMAGYLPRAGIYVHPRGARHLINPARLTAGARAIYGENFDRLFGEILPVPGERVHTPADGEFLDLGGGRTLTFYHTPGHARHHFIVHDPASRGVFSGDTLGVRFQALSRLVGFDLALPSTPPPEFDPAGMMETLDRIGRLDLDYIYFAHYGRAGGINAILAGLREQINIFDEMGRKVLASGGGAGEIEKAIWDTVMGRIATYGLNDREHPAVRFMGPDIRLNAAGLNHYLREVAGIAGNR